MCNWLGVAPFRAVEDDMIVFFVPGLCARVLNQWLARSSSVYYFVGGR